MFLVMCKEPVRVDFSIKGCQERLKPKDKERCVLGYS